MTSIFNPSGTLNVAWDAADLPGEGDGRNEISGAMVRCKNLRTNEQGKAVTRDGSAKINGSAINTAIWWLEEMDGERFAFAGTAIYKDEASLATGLTSAQWSAFQYNAFNDDTKQIFALNGTDRKRITTAGVNEWGIDTPTVKPVLGSGGGTGLTGIYTAIYTYVRKVNNVIVAESNPSPVSDPIDLTNDSLTAQITASADPQVTHARLYRTSAGGNIYYLDTEIEVATTYAYGYSEGFEETDGYISGTGFKFTVEDTENGTENTYTWEYAYKTLDLEDTGNDGTPPYYPDDDEPYSRGDHWDT